MRVIPPVFSDPDYFVHFSIQIKGVSHYVFFRSLGSTELKGNLEAYLSCAVLPCMKAGGGVLVTEGKIDKKFLIGLEKIQNIYCTWNNSFKRITTKGEHREHREPGELSGKRVAMFFSGGLNSFYTLLKNRDIITDLIFVHGLDIKLPNMKLREKVAAKIHEIASHFKKNVIEIETNVRESLDVFAEWEGMSQGAALASIGHLLSSEFRKVYIPAALAHSNMVPWGCHPQVDPHWGSSSLEFISDGAEVTRMKKVAYVSKNDSALQYIRVCSSNLDSRYNCCRCEKCVQTMIGLKIQNALEGCATFKKEICLEDVRRINAALGLSRSRAQINFNELEKAPDNEELKCALKEVLERPEWINIIELTSARIWVKIKEWRLRKVKIFLQRTLKRILPVRLHIYLRRFYLRVMSKYRIQIY